MPGKAPFFLVDELVIDAQIRLLIEGCDGSGVLAPQYGRGRGQWK